jgi:hypothetical protein
MKCVHVKEKRKIASISVSLSLSLIYIYIYIYVFLPCTAPWIVEKVTAVVLSLLPTDVVERMRTAVSLKALYPKPQTR